MRSVEGRVAFITGAAGGLGYALAQRLAEAGSRIVLVDRDPNVVVAAAQLGPAHLGIVADVAKQDSLDAAVERVIEETGGIDLLICNAGIGSASTVRVSTSEQLLRIVDINLNGQIRTVKAALESVISRRGHIVFTCSAAVLKHVPRSSAYAASKAGIDAFAGALRQELRARGVTVGVVYPGWIPTPLTTARSSRGAQAARSMPWPFNLITPLETAAERYARAVIRRSRNVYMPRVHRVAHWLRPLATGRVWDRRMARRTSGAIEAWERQRD